MSMSYMSCHRMLNVNDIYTWKVKLWKFPHRTHYGVKYVCPNVCILKRKDRGNAKVVKDSET